MGCNWSKPVTRVRGISDRSVKPLHSSPLPAGAAQQFTGERSSDGVTCLSIVDCRRLSNSPRILRNVVIGSGDQATSDIATIRRGRRGTQWTPPSSVSAAVADRVVVHNARSASEVERVLPSAEIVLLWDFSSPLLQQHFHRARSLRWVHVAGAGVDAIMTPEIESSPVVVTNARGVFNRSIAETVVAMMLVFAKDMLTTIALQSQNRWLHRDTEMLAGQTAVVVGAGEIGRAIGRAARALGVEVIGVATSERFDQDLGLVRSIEDLDTLLPIADFVVLILPLTDRTHGLIGEEQLASMKPTSRLINVGRGQLVDEHALVVALQSGSIAGAALDVFQTEPLPPDSPLWRMPNVIVSPAHVGRLPRLARGAGRPVCRRIWIGG